ncbi:TetR/AcrR family transcriptional regulator [Vibrio sp. 99-70-13A1]|uniref:TetR/AcrR family transcriptional regulator n=1 Tax=Vibrio sp. 99-70-13A1 TaxID=2607601 RepID=UPI001493B117|nr:TetR/AcrR family transcriptional regulator [Vibrio sp. 99-70-13A1]NOH95835.1 TetR/AcrR family transcriptional regulator [Vibrio sp. 99-70-13A1]
MSKKEHILDVAESLFNQFGYTAVGVDMIRDSAEVSKTSMYRHFGSKTKLIEAVLARRHQRFESSLASRVDGHSSVMDRLNALLDWHFDWFEQPDFKGCMFMHALAEFKETEETIAMLSYQHKAWLKESVIGCLELNDNLNAAQMMMKTEILMTFIEGMIVRSEFGVSMTDQNQYRQSVQALVHA